MKKERIDKIYAFLDAFEKMGYKVLGGLYSDEFEVYEGSPDFKENSLLFTEYQIVNAIMDSGFLRIINNIKDEPVLVEMLIEQFDMECYMDSNGDIWIRTYIKELKENYCEQRRSKAEILEQNTDI
jgi:hypothetical protein